MNEFGTKEEAVSQLISAARVIAESDPQVNTLFCGVQESLGMLHELARQAEPERALAAGMALAVLQYTTARLAEGHVEDCIQRVRDVCLEAHKPPLVPGVCADRSNGIVCTQEALKNDTICSTHRAIENLRRGMVGPESLVPKPDRPHVCAISGCERSWPDVFHYPDEKGWTPGLGGFICPYHPRNAAGRTEEEERQSRIKAGKCPECGSNYGHHDGCSRK